MPEVPLCIHCKRAIDQMSDQYVVTNKYGQEQHLLALCACTMPETYGDGEVNEIQSRLNELACDYVNTQNE